VPRPWRWSRPHGLPAAARHSQGRQQDCRMSTVLYTYTIHLMYDIGRQWSEQGRWDLRRVQGPGEDTGTRGVYRGMRLRRPGTRNRALVQLCVPKSKTSTSSRYRPPAQPPEEHPGAPRAAAQWLSRGRGLYPRAASTRRHVRADVSSAPEVSEVPAAVGGGIRGAPEDHHLLHPPEASWKLPGSFPVPRPVPRPVSFAPCPCT